MRRKQNLHDGKLKAVSKRVKKNHGSATSQTFSAGKSEAARAGLKWWAQKYVDNGAYCLKHGIGGGTPMKS
jgi:hypothetical protein